MEKFIAVVFDTEKAAFEGETAIRELHKDGELAVYAAAVIGKDEEGNVEVKKFSGEGPIGTAFGLILGGVIGVLAGPVAVATGAVLAGSAAAASAAASGMVAGSLTGSMFGMARDLWVAGIDTSMLDQVSLELLPGKSCLVASVDEFWTTPLDAKMSELGGVAFRKPRIDAIDEQYEADMAEFHHEITELKDEIRQSSEDTKKAFNDKIDAVKEKVSDAKDKIEARMTELSHETEERLDAIDQQIKAVNENNRAKFEKRKIEIKADYYKRKSKLDAAMVLAKDALT